MRLTPLMAAPMHLTPSDAFYDCHDPRSQRNLIDPAVPVMESTAKKRPLWSQVHTQEKELFALRHMLEDLTDKTIPHAVESNHPLLLEMVLILRQLAKPEHVRIAQGELKRLGVLSI